MNRWLAIKQRDPAAADAAPKRNRTWTDAEDQAVLAAGMGKSGTSTDAFWKSACAACPILAERGPVRSCTMLCTSHQMELSAKHYRWASSHRCMQVCGLLHHQQHVCAGHLNFVGRWLAMLTPCHSCALQGPCKQHFLYLKYSKEDASKADASWSEEEDAKLNAALEGRASESELKAALKTEPLLEARGVVNLPLLFCGMSNSLASCCAVIYNAQKHMARLAVNMCSLPAVQSL